MFFFFGPFFLLLPLIVLLLAARFLSGFFRHLFHDDTERLMRHPGGESPLARRPERDRIESRVVSLAYRLGGRVTVSDVVIDTSLGIKESEEVLDHMTDEVRVRMVVDERGLVTYEFPEIIDRIEREKR
jgi:hypothetical protein